MFRRRDARPFAVGEDSATPCGSVLSVLVNWAWDTAPKREAPWASVFPRRSKIKLNKRFFGVLLALAICPSPEPVYPCDKQHAFLSQLATGTRRQLVAMTENKAKEVMWRKNLWPWPHHHPERPTKRAKLYGHTGRRGSSGGGCGGRRVQQLASLHPEVPEHSTGHVFQLMLLRTLALHWPCEAQGSGLEMRKTRAGDEKDQPHPHPPLQTLWSMLWCVH